MFINAKMYYKIHCIDAINKEYVQLLVKIKGI